MKSEAELFGGGPAEVLAAAARRLGVAFDPLSLAERFDAHSSPQSLLALVEVARRLGIEARAFESDLAGLADAALPAVVHLKSPASDETSFALLVGREPGALVLEGPPGIGSRRLERDEFRKLWSGIVVTLSALGENEAASVAPREPLARRLRDFLRRRRPGGPAVSAARFAGLAAVPLLALGTLARLAAQRGSPWPALGGALAVALALAAAFACMTLLLASRRSQVPTATPRLAAAICGRGKLVDCESVLSSRYARIAGIDLASLGLAFFSSVLSVAAIGWVLPGAALASLLAWLALAFLAAVPGSVALIAVQVYPLRRFCPLCMIVHAAVIGSAAMGLPLLLALHGVSEALGALWPWAVLHAAAFLGALGLVVPYLELGLESRVLLARLGWIASTPWGALAEIAGRPAAGPIPRFAPIRLGDADAPFRIDALVHPFCTACPPVVEQLARLAARHADALVVGFHLPPRDLSSEADHELCAALGAAGMIAGGEQTLHLYRAVKERPRAMLRLAEGGAAAVLASFLPPDVDSGPVLPEARAAVAAADRLSDALKRGTPTVLLNGRPWDAPLEDLDALLSHHPELLATVLGLATPRRDERREAEASA